MLNPSIDRSQVSRNARVFIMLVALSFLVPLAALRLPPRALRAISEEGLFFWHSRLQPGNHFDLDKRILGKTRHLHS